RRGSGRDKRAVAERQAGGLVRRKPSKNNDEQRPPADPPAGAAPRGPAPRGGGAGGAGGGALLEPPEEAVARLAPQLAELKDRHLRLAADYENFRRRTQKERTELWAKAQADLLQRLGDALDDLARFARAD